MNEAIYTTRDGQSLTADEAYAAGYRWVVGNDDSGVMLLATTETEVDDIWQGITLHDGYDSMLWAAKLFDHIAEGGDAADDSPEAELTAALELLAMGEFDGLVQDSHHRGRFDEEPANYTGAKLTISDHGNAELYHVQNGKSVSIASRV